MSMLRVGGQSLWPALRRAGQLSCKRPSYLLPRGLPLWALPAEGRFIKCLTEERLVLPPLGTCELTRWFRRDAGGGLGITRVHAPRETDVTGGWPSSGHVRMVAPSLKATVGRAPIPFPRFPPASVEVSLSPQWRVRAKPRLSSVASLLLEQEGCVWAAWPRRGSLAVSLRRVQTHRSSFPLPSGGQSFMGISGRRGLLQEEKHMLILNVVPCNCSLC